MIEVKKLIKYPYLTFSILLLFQILQYVFFPCKNLYNSVDFNFWYLLFNVVVFSILVIAYVSDVKLFVKSKLKWTLKEGLLHHCFVGSFANLILFVSLLIVILLEGNAYFGITAMHAEFIFQLLLSFYSIFLTFVVSINIAISINNKKLVEYISAKVIV